MFVPCPALKHTSALLMVFAESYALHSCIHSTNHPWVPERQVLFNCWGYSDTERYNKTDQISSAFMILVA